MPNTLLIFLKPPRAGYVKTRLARTVGDAEALRIYRFLLDKTRAAVLGVAAVRQLWFAEPPDGYDEWPAEQFSQYLQTGADLGARMAHAFEQAFADGAERVVIVGSDCPLLETRHIEEAFAALSASELCLGPTPDGGYYLLGMRRFYPDLFRNIAWSTPAVLPATLDIAGRLGLSTHLLPELPDIDTEEDWKVYLSDNQPL